jgi:hypothetical protein
VSGESKRVKLKALLVSGEWNRFLTSQSDFLIYLAAGDFGVLADLDGGKEERVKQKRGMEMLTGERKGQFTLFFISVEIVNSEVFTFFTS